MAKKDLAKSKYVAGYIENESIQSLEDMLKKNQSVVFPTSAIYSKAVYDTLQEFPVSYLMVCEAIREDGDFKNLNWVCGGGIVIFKVE